MKIASKWRPTLTQIILLMMGFVLLLPVAGIGFFRLFENQLIKATETELIAQSAAIAAVMKSELLEDSSRPIAGARVQPQIKGKRSLGIEGGWKPVLAQLDLSKTTIRDDNTGALPSKFEISDTYKKLGIGLTPVLIETQKITLAGFRVLDFNGTVIAGRADVGLSFAHIAEVKKALQGQYQSALVKRAVKNPQPISSISRGTTVRIMTALPVIVRDRVAGVIFASRTPSNIFKELYFERQKLFFAIAAILTIVLLLAFIFSRAISSPINELTDRTRRIGKGDRQAIAPLQHHGSRELHQLSTSFLDMAKKLVDRSEYINTFATHVTHEMKSPLTSIRGASEILLENDADMSAEDRQQFLSNIKADTERMTLLLDRLRELARADSLTIGGQSNLKTVIASITDIPLRVQMREDQTAILPLAEEAAVIVFANLFENASQNGATDIEISVNQRQNELTVLVSDNGAGISSGNRDTIFDMFFTTRRQEGGTGLGLGIVRSLIEAHGGTISYLDRDTGATFRLIFPNSGQETV